MNNQNPDAERRNLEYMTLDEYVRRMDHVFKEIVKNVDKTTLQKNSDMSWDVLQTVAQYAVYTETLEQMVYLAHACGYELSVDFKKKE